MASNIEKLDHNEEKLTIQVSKEDFSQAMHKAYNKNKQYFNIPGFRKGKAPFPIVLNYYGESAFYEDAIDFVLDDAYKAALKEHDAKPFSQPEIDVEEIGMDKGVTFTARYALKPVVKLGDYKGLKAYRPSVEVEESEIDKQLDDKRLELARLVPVERPVAEGDFVVMDYKGSKDGVAFDGGSAEDHTLEIGSGQFIPGFEDGLIGHSAGEEFDLDLTFPEQYHSEDLAGQAVVFHVNLKEVKERQLPDLDDEFIKDISEDCDTVEAYKADLRKKLEEKRTTEADREFEEHLLDQIAKNSEYEMSHLLIHDEMHRLFNQQAQMMMYYGMRMEDYLRMMGMTRDQYMASLHEPAEHSLKKAYALEAIAEAEGLEATDEEIETEIANLATAYGMEKDKFEENMDEDQRQSLADQARLKKAAEILRSYSEATDEPPVEEEPEKEAEESDDHKAEDQEAETQEAQAAEAEPVEE